MTDRQVKFNHVVDFDMFPDNPIVVDVGVCRGQFIEFLRTHTKTNICKIFGLEASSFNFNKLGFSELGDVEIHHIALVGEDNIDSIAFNEYANHPGWGSVIPRHTDSNLVKRLSKIVTTYDVKAIGINKLFDFLSIDHIDFLKMDIEGIEYSVFDNMSMDVASKIKQMSIEIHEKSNITWDMVSLSKNILGRLKHLGFKCEYNKAACEVWCVRV